MAKNLTIIYLSSQAVFTLCPGRKVDMSQVSCVGSHSNLVKSNKMIFIWIIIIYYIWDQMAAQYATCGGITGSIGKACAPCLCPSHLGIFKNKYWLYNIRVDSKPISNGIIKSEGIHNVWSERADEVDGKGYHKVVKYYYYNGWLRD